MANEEEELTVSDIMTRWPATLSVFMRYRMLCVGCLIAPFHTVREACAEYDLDEKAILIELEKAIRGSEHPSR